MPARSSLARSSLVRTLLAAGLALVAAAGCGGCTVLEGSAGPGGEPGRPVTVTRVVDGDTVHAVPADRPGAAPLKIRVLGIDAPETGESGAPAECWAAESTAFARAALLGRTVALVADPTQAQVDRYGRTLGYLMLPDGRNFSVLAAGAGAARSYVYDRPVRADPAIRWAEADALAARRGLWGGCPAAAGR